LELSDLAVAALFQLELALQVQNKAVGGVEAGVFVVVEIGSGECSTPRSVPIRPESV
jgi:hypothetical protein